MDSRTCGWSSRKVVNTMDGIQKWSDLRMYEKQWRFTRVSSDCMGGWMVG